MRTRGRRRRRRRLRLRSHLKRGEERQGDEKRRSDPSSVAEEGGGRATSVVVMTPFASVAAGSGRGRRTVETSGASASVPSRDSVRGMRGGLQAGVAALGDREATKGKRERDRDADVE